MQRRNFLKMLGLGAAASPLVASGLGLAGLGRSAYANTGTPLRLVLIPMLNGVEPAYFWPTGGSMKLVGEPLAPFADQLTFVKGIDVEGSENHYAIRSMYTGATISDYASADPTVASIDQVVAEQFLADAPSAVKSMHLGALPASAIEFYQKNGRSTFFFSPSPVHYDANPVTAFDKFFGSLSADPGAPVSKDWREQVLGVTDAELAALEARLEGSGRELDKLDTHRAAVDSLATQLVPPAPQSCDNTPIAAVEALRAELQGDESAAYRNDLFEPIYDAQVDILARGLVCGLTRVGTLQANEADGNVIVPVLGGMPHHLTSHESGANFAEVQRWYASKVARLLTQLNVQDPLDPNGNTVLHNSLVLWMSECNPGHGSADVPVMYAGAAGGRLKTGTVIDVPGATSKQLMQTIASVMGVGGGASAHFGDTQIQEIKA